MLLKDRMEMFKLGRKWWQELQQRTEVDPEDLGFFLAWTVNESDSHSDKDFALKEVKSRRN